MTSGSYTDSAPVAGFRIVACTKAPRAAAFVIVHPDAAGVMPLGPVSWYGVARPCALSGLAGTTMLQFTFVVAAAAVAVAVAVAVGQIVGAADAVAVAAVVAAVVGAVVAVVVGAAVAAVVAAVVAAAVPSGVGAAVPDGVGAAVAATAAVVAVDVAAGVAQPATFAASLAPNTLRKPGATRSAKPRPATTATTPPIAISRVRDRGSRS
jgi:hypothetical protein